MENLLGPEFDGIVEFLPSVTARVHNKAGQTIGYGSAVIRSESQEALLFAQREAYIAAVNNAHNRNPERAEALPNLPEL